MRRTVDQWGRVIFDADDAVELLLRGYNICDLSIASAPLIEQYNKACFAHNKADYTISPPNTPTVPPAEAAIRRQARWWMPDEYQTLDIRTRLLSQCQTSEQIDRVVLELQLFEALELIPVLRLLCFLVDQWRASGVLWGVGRGSSVASYCLYLIGVHRIDSLAYQLDINEFLKP